MKKLFYCLSVLFIYAASVFSDSISLQISNRTFSVTKNGEKTIFNSQTFHTEPGEPMLPVNRMRFLLPPDADLNSIDVKLETSGTIMQDGLFNVESAPLERTEYTLINPSDKRIIDGKNIDIYSANSFFPSTHLQESTTGMLRDYKIVNVSIFPYQYNPVTSKLRYFSSGVITINYKRIAGFRKNVAYQIPQRTNQLLKELVSNYDEMAEEYKNYAVSRKANGGYLIITTGAIKSGSNKLNEFIDSKKNRGFTVETKIDLGGADDIRAWLAANYQSKNIEYVLLIGDPTTGTGDVPMKMTHPWRETPTDFYYSDLSGNWDKNGNGKFGETGDLGSGGIDLLGEVGVGRIPVYNNNYQTLDNILSKTVEYECAPESKIDWRRKMMMAMKGYNAPAEGSRVGEAVKSKVSSLNSQWSYYRIYDDGTGSPELTGVSENFILYAMGMVKTGFVIWMTHGSATDAMSVMSLNGATQWNMDNQAFVFCGSCLNATPSKSNNLTYTLLKNGSIGAIGGTQTTLFSTGASMENTGFNSAYIYQFSTNLAGKSMHVSDALNTVKASNPPSGDNLQNYMAFNLYGCPAIGIETNGNTTNNKVLFETTNNLVNPMSIKCLNSGNTLHIDYEIHNFGSVDLALYSTNGKLLKTLYKGDKAAGSYTVTYNLKELNAGFYIIRLVNGKKTTVNKVILN